ncbi:sodium:proton antiporter [Anatilimnocola sp. NA78]|uniref:sodium:proton antiporter n=1 Tax=Anatilimnocola sp. NA78 TaxID=3415683 RepID=UPI003CE48253
MINLSVKSVALWAPLAFFTIGSLLVLPGVLAAQEAAATAPPAATAQSEPTTDAATKEEHAHADGHQGHDAAEHAAHSAMGNQLHPISVLPFGLLLLCIAVFPLVNPHWWEHNSNKAIIVAALSIPLAAYLVYAFGNAGVHEIAEKLHEYVSFMILLAALYVISGGIYIKGSLNGTPLANTLLLLIGALLASFIGTTGASVLLIRPLLRANRTRKRVAHVVVFFIFIVSNCGGLLTPLGDPPLFMGFLKGVPFEWTLVQLWPHWLMVNIILLVVFNIWDQVVFAKEEKERAGSQLEEVMKHEPIGMEGGLNILFLLGIVAIIYSSGNFSFLGQKPWPIGVAEGMMAGLAICAYLTTSKENRLKNRFTFGPIIEVAVLFIGIFITMAPALQILNAWGRPIGGRELFGMKLTMHETWQYFWVTGLLSSFLDNAPTYMTMAATACGTNNIEVTGAAYLKTFLDTEGEKAIRLLAAISCGAVFMGANTYIGNGPNFMVKAIAEENNVRMPSFFGYMVYSGVVLIPVFVLVTFVFFR